MLSRTRRLHDTLLLPIREEGTMTYLHILVEVEDGVGVLTLNRPEKLNAMNRKLGRNCITR